MFTLPVLQNLYLDRHFDLDTFGRGVVATVTGVGVLLVLPFSSKRYDALYREDPARTLRFLGLFILPVAVVLPIQYVMPNTALFTIVGILPGILLVTTFTLVGPILQSIVPYRLRGMGTALGSVYVFFVGATARRPPRRGVHRCVRARGAVLLVGVPATLIGGLLLVRSSASIKGDLSLVVAELREELADEERRRNEPESIPTIQIDAVDFSYGHVQILFDVELRGPARRSPRAASARTGRARPRSSASSPGSVRRPRGVVRLHGAAITYVAPEQRVKLGVRLLPGGKGVFRR